MTGKTKAMAIEQMKRQAKQLRKALQVKHMQALHLIATQNGYKNWGDALRKLDVSPTIQRAVK